MSMSLRSKRSRFCIKVTALVLVLSHLTACGGTPKDVDREGLRDRADQETSQVR